MDIISKFEDIARQDRRFGPCEDDCEITSPYIDMLPEESDDEDGSPLSF